MSGFRKIVKYEFLNILRNRWVFLYALAVALICAAFIRIGGEGTKALVSFSEVMTTLTPLVASLFSVIYWYNSDRFTELLLTQPIRRSSLFRARWLAVSSALATSLAIGTLLSFAALGSLSSGLLLILGVGLFLSVVFATLGMWIAIGVKDRMKGIGLALMLWFYFTILHDGFVLLVLLAFRDYPLDVPSVVLGSLNPIGLSRVSLLTFFDASLLLGHTGAIVRKALMEWHGAVLGLLIAVAWVVVPTASAAKVFSRRDF